MKNDPARLETQDGRRGVVDLQENEAGMVRLQMDSGIQVWAPSGLLEYREDRYFLPVDLEQITASSAPISDERQTVLVIPLAQEELKIERRKTETGRVRIQKEVHSREETVDEPTYVEEVNVVRVPVNKVLESPVAPRHENGTLIIPLMEEVLVVEKRLMLKEELRVSKRRREIRNPVQVTLRSEEASVEKVNR
jgi:uncharacterized protein (TIGR02271 family)